MAVFQVKNIEKIYQEEGVETRALQGVSFAVEKGEFVAIMGPSGSGKSTLLHILGFLDKQTSGEYLFEGKTMQEYSEKDLAEIRNKKMGFVFQAFNLLARTTVLENVKLPLLYSSVKEQEWDGLSRNAIAAVGLSQRRDYETSQLSGGEKQRAAIARALVNDPQVIFADEPTGNLDSGSGKQIMDILEKLNKEQGRTILLITHEYLVAERARRIIHLVDGKVASDIKRL